MLAAAKLAGYAADGDGDGALAHRPLAAAARRLSRRGAGQALAGSRPLRFDAGVLLDGVERRRPPARSHHP